MSLEIYQFACLQDNYGYLIRDQASGDVAAIDTPEVDVINNALAEKGWSLTHIFNTHHHFDHAGGNLALKEQWNCTIVGPKAEAARIPGIDIAVGEGDEVRLGETLAHIHDTPGHTLGHIVFHFAGEGVAFVGDTLFALGCGRLFEGTAEQMWQSLLKLKNWPESTTLYCAHEYTQANARFALSVDPDNEALKKRCIQIDELRADGKPTVPSRLDVELATNPFLRADQPALKLALGMDGAGDVDVFAQVRTRKDNF